MRIIFSFESSNAESLEDLTFEDVMKAVNGNLKKEDKNVVAQKMILSSASFLKKVFPKMGKPIN